MSCAHSVNISIFVNLCESKLSGVEENPLQWEAKVMTFKFSWPSLHRECSGICVLCPLFFVLCPLFFILCCAPFVIYSVFCVLLLCSPSCPRPVVLCPSFCVRCPLFCFLFQRPLFCALCSVLHVLCSMFSVLCSVSFVLFSVSVASTDGVQWTLFSLIASCHPLLHCWSKHLHAGSKFYLWGICNWASCHCRVEKCIVERAPFIKTQKKCLETCSI